MSDQEDDLNINQLVENLFLREGAASGSTDDLSSSKQNNPANESDTNIEQIEASNNDNNDDGQIDMEAIIQGVTSSMGSNDQGTRRNSFLLPARRRKSSVYNDFVAQSIQSFVNQQRQPQQPSSQMSSGPSAGIVRRESMGQDQDWSQIFQQGLFQDIQQEQHQDLNRKTSLSLLEKSDEERFRNAILTSLRDMEEEQIDNDHAIADDESDDNHIIEHHSKKKTETSSKSSSHSKTKKSEKKKNDKKKAVSESSDKTPKKPKKPKKKKSDHDKPVVAVATPTLLPPAPTNIPKRHDEHLSLVESAIDDLLLESINVPKPHRALPPTDSAQNHSSETSKTIDYQILTPDIVQESLPKTQAKKKQKKQKKQKSDTRITNIPKPIVSEVIEDNTDFSKELADIINSVVDNTFKDSLNDQQSKASVAGPSSFQTIKPFQSTSMPIAKPSEKRSKVNDEIDMFQIMQDAMALASKGTVLPPVTISEKPLKKTKSSKLKSKKVSGGLLTTLKPVKTNKNSKKNDFFEKQVDLGINIGEILENTLTTKEKEAARRKKTQKMLLSSAPLIPMSSFTSSFPAKYRKMLSANKSSLNSSEPQTATPTVQIPYKPVTDLSQYFRPQSDTFVASPLSSKPKAAKEKDAEKDKSSKKKEKKSKKKKSKKDKKSKSKDKKEKKKSKHKDKTSGLLDLHSATLLPAVDPNIDTALSFLDAENTQPVPETSAAEKQDKVAKPPKVKHTKSLTTDEYYALWKKRYLKCARQAAKVCNEKFVKPWKLKEKELKEEMAAQTKQASAQRKEERAKMLKESAEELRILTEAAERGPPYPSFLKLTKRGKPKRPLRRFTKEELARREILKSNGEIDDFGRYVNRSYRSVTPRVSTMNPRKRLRIERLKTLKEEYSLGELSFRQIERMFDPAAKAPSVKDSDIFHPPWELPLHPPLSLPSVHSYNKQKKYEKKMNAEAKISKMEERENKKEKKKQSLQKRMAESAASAMASLLPLLSKIPPENVAIINSLKALIAARAAVAIARTRKDKHLVSNQVHYIIQQAKINISKALTQNPSLFSTPQVSNVASAKEKSIVSESALTTCNTTEDVINIETDGEDVEMTEVAATDSASNIAAQDTQTLPGPIIVKKEGQEDNPIVVSENDSNKPKTDLKELVGNIFTELTTPLIKGKNARVVKIESNLSNSPVTNLKVTKPRKKTEMIINTPDIPDIILKRKAFQQRQASVKDEIQKRYLQQSTGSKNSVKINDIQINDVEIIGMRKRDNVQRILEVKKESNGSDVSRHSDDQGKVITIKAPKQKSVPKLKKIDPKEKVKSRLEARQETIKYKFSKYTFDIPDKHLMVKYTPILKRLEAKLSGPDFTTLKKEVLTERKRRWRMDKAVKREFDDPNLVGGTHAAKNGVITNVTDNEVLNVVVFLFNKKNVVDEVLQEMRTEVDEAKHTIAGRKKRKIYESTHDSSPGPKRIKMESKNPVIVLEEPEIKESLQDTQPATSKDIIVVEDTQSHSSIGSPENAQTKTSIVTSEGTPSNIDSALIEINEEPSETVSTENSLVAEKQVSSSVAKDTNKTEVENQNLEAEPKVPELPISTKDSADSNVDANPQVADKTKDAEEGKLALNDHASASEDRNKTVSPMETADDKKVEIDNGSPTESADNKEVRIDTVSSSPLEPGTKQDLDDMSKELCGSQVSSADVVNTSVSEKEHPPKTHSNSSPSDEAEVTQTSTVLGKTPAGADKPTE